MSACSASLVGGNKNFKVRGLKLEFRRCRACTEETHMLGRTADSSAAYTEKKETLEERRRLSRSSTGDLASVLTTMGY